MMDVGGFFFIFEPIPGATGSVSRSTGETSSTAPLSGHRRLYVAAVRQSMRRRRDGGPGRLEQLGRSRAVPWTGLVDVVAVRSARTTSRDCDSSTLTPSTRRVRRNATPFRYYCRAPEAMQCVCGAALIKRAAMVASWHRCVILRGRCVRLVIDALG